MVTGLFPDTASLERAYQAVAQRGYGQGDINVVMSDETRKRYHSEPHRTDVDLGKKSLEGGEFGGPAGGMLGTLIPACVAMGAMLAFPPAALVAAGPVAVALAGAGAAGVAAGTIAALSDWGVPEARLRQYEQGIHDGGILLALKPRADDDPASIEEEWKAAGGRFVFS
jgi:hypothetical protein